MPFTAASETGGSTTIVVVCHNTREDLERCLRTVSGSACELVVVDTASTDGSVELVHDRFPEVRMISLPENIGYGAAANAGIAASSSPYVLLLNADAWPREDAVRRMVELAEARPEVALIGPRLLNFDGTTQRSVFASPSRPISLAVWAAAPHLVSGAYEVVQRFARAGQDVAGRDAVPGVREITGREYLQGAALFLRASAIEQVGGFDESFFMFSEEADLCYRLRAAGWSTVFLEAAGVYHRGGASTRQYPVLMYQELLDSHVRLLGKYVSPDAAARARRLLVKGVRVRAALHRGARRQRYSAAADALSDGDRPTRPSSGWE
jgi:N-acetylglucosaminyl-diphospho-decaprenol L-rhamnosyltransferase